MVNSEINLVGAIHEAAEDEWDKAIELWFYDHPTGFSSHLLQVLEDHAVEVYRELLEMGAWGPGNCDEATQAWSRVFDREGVQYKIVNGFYAPRHKAGQSHMSSAEHVWMEVEGGVFDPTAGQFKGRLSLNNYWWDDATHAYGPQAGPKPVYEARKSDSSVRDNDPKRDPSRWIHKIITAYNSITDEDAAALEELGIFDLAGQSNKSLMYTNYDDTVLDHLDNMAPVKPLYNIFRRGELISADDLETQLTAFSKRGSDKAVMDLIDAEDALVALLKYARKTYSRLVAKSEADPDDPLGRIAFANDRPGMPRELDTKIEEKLKKALMDHFVGLSILSKENTQLIHDLMAKGLYPSMFSEPTNPVLVRGMSVSSKWLTKAIGRKPGPRGSAEVKFKFVPKRGATSWTTSKSVAEGFHIMGSEVDIIMYASVADNPGKFLSSRGFYSTSIARRFSNEKESLGLGPIKVFKIEWKINEE